MASEKIPSKIDEVTGEDVISANNILDGMQTYAATDFVTARSKGQIEMVPFASLTPWADNPREDIEYSEQALLPLLSLFGTENGRHVWSQLEPAIIAILPDGQEVPINGNRRIVLFNKHVPADKQPLEVPAIKIAMTKSDCIRYALDDSEGERVKSRWAREMYMLSVHDCKPSTTYADWIARLAKQSPATMAMFAPAAERCADIAALVKATYGSLGKYWRVARYAPELAKREYIDTRRHGKQDGKVLTSIDQMDKVTREAVKQARPLDYQTYIAIAREMDVAKKSKVSPSKALEATYPTLPEMPAIVHAIVQTLIEGGPVKTADYPDGMPYDIMIGELLKIVKSNTPKLPRPPKESK